MSIAWETYHRRSAVVQEVVRRLDRSVDGQLPWPDIAGATEAFRDSGELLAALQERWHAALATRVELALETGSGDLTGDVAAAWHGLARELPGLRRVLDRHAAHPALIHARRSELRMLAMAAGLATLETPIPVAAEAGEALAGSRPLIPRPRFAARLAGMLRRRPDRPHRASTRATVAHHQVT